LYISEGADHPVLEAGLHHRCRGSDHRGCDAATLKMRLTQETHPESGTTSYTVNAAGLVAGAQQDMDQEFRCGQGAETHDVPAGWRNPAMTTRWRDIT
jgi:hypothetical protein